MLNITNLSTEFLGRRLDSFHVFFDVSSFFAEEDQKVALNFTTEYLLGGFLGEFNDEWQ